MVITSSNKSLKLLLVLLSAVGMCQGQCTQSELNTLLLCIYPYNDLFIRTLGQGGTCYRNLITATLCSSFDVIVTCVNGASVSTKTCRPYGVAQIDSQLVIPCKVNDFVATCTSAPKINQGSGAARLTIAYDRVLILTILGHAIPATVAWLLKSSS